MMAAVHRYEGTVNQVWAMASWRCLAPPLPTKTMPCGPAMPPWPCRLRCAVHRGGAPRPWLAGADPRGAERGEVVVRAIGSDLHMDYTAVGQTTHLAARMEQMAMPGSIVITPAMLRLAEGYVQVKPLGPVAVKGLQSPWRSTRCWAPGRAAALAGGRGARTDALCGARHTNWKPCARRWSSAGRAGPGGGAGGGAGSRQVAPGV